VFFGEIALSLEKIKAMYVKRFIEKSIKNHLQKSNDIVVVYGARQVGKTTMLNKILDESEFLCLKINAEELMYNDIFSSRDLSQMKQLVQGYQLVFIDEAQTIENIGINIKILHDAMPNLKIVLSGSSSFDLSNKIKEPLTGRTKTYLLYSLAYCELKEIYNDFELTNRVKSSLVIGEYPRLSLLDTRQEQIAHLRELASAYLYRDLLIFKRIKHARKLYDLLKLLAFQIGNTVSINELSNKLKIQNETVESYINLLEQAFIVFRVSGFSRNLRKEISKQDKIFFYDLGIRNSIINNFAPLDGRNDVGQLWENFLMVERMKNNQYNERFCNTYFWRVYTGAEIDCIEDCNGSLFAFEFKFGKKIPKIPKTWRDNYPQATFDYVNQTNFLNFIAK